MGSCVPSVASGKAARPRGWGLAATKERGRVVRAIKASGGELGVNMCYRMINVKNGDGR